LVVKWINPYKTTIWKKKKGKKRGSIKEKKEAAVERREKGRDLHRERKCDCTVLSLDCNSYAYLYLIQYSTQRGNGGTVS
jgi:hypothetical protein